MSSYSKSSRSNESHKYFWEVGVKVRPKNTKSLRIILNAAENLTSFKVAAIFSERDSVICVLCLVKEVMNTFLIFYGDEADQYAFKFHDESMD